MGFFGDVGNFVKSGLGIGAVAQPTSVLGTVLGGLGAWSNYQAQKDYNQQQSDAFWNNLSAQYDFAKNSVQWRTADAKAAGIHPLAALGMQGLNFSPISIGGVPNTALGDFAVDMGQNLTRAAMAQKSPEERRVGALQIENFELQNDLLREQLRASRWNTMRQVGPAVSGLDAVTEPAFRLESVGDGAYQVSRRNPRPGLAGEALDFLADEVVPLIGMHPFANEVTIEGVPYHYNHLSRRYLPGRSKFILDWVR